VEKGWERKKDPGLMSSWRGKGWYPVRVVCLDLCDTLENPTRGLGEGGFLQSFIEEMRGFHDFLRQTPYPVFILLKWSSVLVTSLLILSVGLVESMLVFWRWM
jgi:hypothetical protein